MNKRVVGTFLVVVAVVVSFSVGFARQHTPCEQMMSKVGEQAKKVRSAEGDVTSANQARDDCHARAKEAKEAGKKKVDCSREDKEVVGAANRLKAEKAKLEALQKEFNAKCGKK